MKLVLTTLLLSIVTITATAQSNFDLLTGNGQKTWKLSAIWFSDSLITQDSLPCVYENRLTFSNTNSLQIDDPCEQESQDQQGNQLQQPVESNFSLNNNQLHMNTAAGTQQLEVIALTPDTLEMSTIANFIVVASDDSTTIDTVVSTLSVRVQYLKE